MTKKTFKAWLKDWDEGSFDFAEAIQGELHREAPADRVDHPHDWRSHPMNRLGRGEIVLFDKLYPFFSLLLAGVMILFLFAAVSFLPAFGSADTPANTSETIQRYTEQGMEETGAVNVVAGVILDYRAFDTLGESHVLFTATIAVMILLLMGHEDKEDRIRQAVLQDDIILKNTAKVMAGFILLFGLYIIFNGHLGPGGGFSGGAVIGGGLILYSTAYGNASIRRIINMKTYRLIVLFALLFYSLAKCYSFYCGANHLESFIHPGTPGRIFSAGLILPLNMAVGIVVACTMYGLYCLFTRRRI